MEVKKLFLYLGVFTCVGLSNCSKKQQMVSASENLSENQAENSLESKVLNGTPTTIEEFPFVVSVRAGGICTGSIINNEWILTAAHCGDGDYIYSGTDVGCGNGGKRYDIALSVQKGYTGITNDIILHKLKEKIQFNAKTAPIGFVKEDYLQYGTLATLIGWAKGGGNGLPDGGGTGGCGRFEYLTSGISNFYHGDNASSLSHVGTPENSSAIRITVTPNSGTRPGDSGGPHFLIAPDGTTIQVAVHSSSDGYQHSYGTRISSFYDWVMATTGLTEAVVTENNQQYTVDASNTTYEGFLSARAFIIDEKSNQLEVDVDQQGNLVTFAFSSEVYSVLKTWGSESFKVEFRFYYGGSYFNKVVSQDFSAKQAMETFLTDDKMIDLANNDPDNFKKLIDFKSYQAEFPQTIQHPYTLSQIIEITDLVSSVTVYRLVVEKMNPYFPSYVDLAEYQYVSNYQGQIIFRTKPEYKIVTIKALDSKGKIMFSILP